MATSGYPNMATSGDSLTATDTLLLPSPNNGTQAMSKPGFGEPPRLRLSDESARLRGAISD